MTCKTVLLSTAEQFTYSVSLWVVSGVDLYYNERVQEVGLYATRDELCVLGLHEDDTNNIVTNMPLPL